MKPLLCCFTSSKESVVSSIDSVFKEFSEIQWHVTSRHTRNTRYIHSGVLPFDSPDAVPIPRRLARPERAESSMAELHCQTGPPSAQVCPLLAGPQPLSGWVVIIFNILNKDKISYLNCSPAGRPGKHSKHFLLPACLLRRIFEVKVEQLIRSEEVGNGGELD